MLNIILVVCIGRGINEYVVEEGDHLEKTYKKSFGVGAFWQVEDFEAVDELLKDWLVHNLFIILKIPKLLHIQFQL